MVNPFSESVPQPSLPITVATPVENSNVDNLDKYCAIQDQVTNSTRALMECRSKEDFMPNPDSLDQDGVQLTDINSNADPKIIFDIVSAMFERPSPDQLREAPTKSFDTALWLAANSHVNQ